MRVKLVVTGRLERVALHRSLARWFPQTGAGEPINFLPPAMFQGPTCNRLYAVGPLPELAQTFSNALVAEALFGSERNSKPPDLVVGVEDLELVNLDQPQVVVGCIRRGVEDYFARNPQGSRTHERWRAVLRERCSFHLMVPMPEAYFFGERAALERAGVGSDVKEQLSCDDLEAFATDDPDFIPRRSDDRRHPKLYLADLLRRSGRDGPRFYRETHDGARALEDLAWPSLTENRQTLAFARALFEDLANAFGVDNPLGDGELAPATCPLDRRKLVLRNL